MSNNWFRVRTSITILTLIFFYPALVLSEVFFAKDEALVKAFPTATQVVQESFILTKEQHKQAEKLAGTRVESRLFTFYVGYLDKKILGHAAIISDTIKTLPGTFLVNIEPSGSLKECFILAFHEPLDYLPTAGWYKQFEQKRTPQSVRIGETVVGIAGSTLTTRAIERGVRKTLALYTILIKDK